jgi:hypothetical protein
MPLDPGSSYPSGASTEAPGDVIAITGRLPGGFKVDKMAPALTVSCPAAAGAYGRVGSPQIERSKSPGRLRRVHG